MSAALLLPADRFSAVMGPGRGVEREDLPEFESWARAARNGQGFALRALYDAVMFDPKHHPLALEQMRELTAVMNTLRGLRPDVHDESSLASDAGRLWQRFLDWFIADAHAAWVETLGEGVALAIGARIFASTTPSPQVNAFATETMLERTTDTMSFADYQQLATESVKEAQLTQAAVLMTMALPPAVSDHVYQVLEELARRNISPRLEAQCNELDYIQWHKALTLLYPTAPTDDAQARWERERGCLDALREPLGVSF